LDPRNWGCSDLAEAAKICPTGALLKKGLVRLWTAGSSRTWGWDGRLPSDLKIASSDSGEVRKAARS
jgi:hypothetical protein